MKAVWNYFAVTLCLTIIQCCGLQIPPTSNTKDVESILTSLNKDTLTTIGKDHNLIGKTSQILTSCPQGYGEEGIYEITVPGLDPFPVLCNAQIAGAGYIVIARRTNVNLNFFRNWTEYKSGFGDLQGDFFIGLDKLHAITKSQTFELYVHLEDFEGNTRFARYDEFYIENEKKLYKMSKLGTYTGDAGDSLRSHKDQKFSTYDNDNDLRATGNCALERLGAWWYEECTESNLFGTYFKGSYSDSLAYKGIVWYAWRGHIYSLSSIKMMVRPRCWCS